ncbi:MAG: arsenate reductase [Ottowia sp.]|nr:arsenate reductase [Ottowia sp.]
MQLTLHGITQCDTVKKARDWLNTQGIPYAFYDFKKNAVSATLLESWLQHVPLTTLLNRRGSTWRALSSDEQQQADSTKGAIALMQTYPSLIKRPVLTTEHIVLVGFDAQQYQLLHTTYLAFKKTQQPIEESN